MRTLAVVALLVVASALIWGAQMLGYAIFGAVLVWLISPKGKEE